MKKALRSKITYCVSWWSLYVILAIITYCCFTEHVLLLYPVGVCSAISAFIVCVMAWNATLLPVKEYKDDVIRKDTDI